VTIEVKKCYQLYYVVVSRPLISLTEHTPLRKIMSYPSKTIGAIILVAASAIAAQPASAQAQRRTQPSDVRVNNNKSLTLRQALELSDRNNREIEAARLTVNRGNAVIRQAQAAEAVRVGVDGSLSRVGGPVVSNLAGAQDSTPLQGGIEATYDIGTAGRNSSLVKAAEEQQRFNQLEVDRVARRVRADVITAYYDMQEADEQLKINEAAVRNAERSLRDAQLQEQAGLGTKFDVIRAEVQKATAEQDVVRVKSQQINARKRLAQLLNVTENVEYTTSEELKPRGEWTVPLENSIILAFANRPELKQQEVQRSISEQQANAAAAGDRAQFSLFARYEAGKDFQRSAGFADDYRVGARVRWDFLDGGATSARVSQERTNQSLADNQYVLNRDQIRLSVEQAFYTLASDRQNIQTSTQAEKQATESLRLARLRFAAGVGTQTDVINAETELTRARSNRLRAIIGYNRSLSTLRNAVYVNQF
jgi:outer membrane protein TolC